MEKKAKKATIKINNLIKKHSFEYLFNLVNPNYIVLGGSISQDEIKRAEPAMNMVILEHLTLLYSTFGANLFTLWDLKIISKEEYYNMPLIKRLNLLLHICNIINQYLQKIKEVSNNGTVYITVN